MKVRGQSYQSPTGKDKEYNCQKVATMRNKRATTKILMYIILEEINRLAPIFGYIYVTGQIDFRSILI